MRKQLAEQSLSCLRMHGFTRSDIYRMLAKGPWVLAFDISGWLPRLCANIKVVPLAALHVPLEAVTSASVTPRSTASSSSVVYSLIR